MSGPVAEDQPDEDAADRVNIDYIKSNFFRTIAPSGLIGSVTPSGLIQVAFFSERQAIPQRVVYRIGPDGALGERLEVVGRDAVVRELDIAVSLDAETAKDLARFLDNMLDSLRSLGETSEKKE